MDLNVQKFPFASSKFSKWRKVRYQETGERRRMFLKSTYSFFFSFFFSFLLLWSSSGISREVVSALNSRADVTSLLVIVLTCFLRSPFVLTDPVHRKTWVFISLHRLQIRHSKILLIFGATASHWLLYFLLFFFFSDFLPDGCMELYAWQRVYTFCMWQPTSQHPVGSFIVNS